MHVEHNQFTNSAEPIPADVIADAAVEAEQPFIPVDLFETVDALMVEGKFAKALQTMMPYVKENQLDVGLLDRTADCFFQVQDTNNAIDVMYFITKQWPDNANAWAKLGLMLQINGDIYGAETALERALDINPFCAPALCALNGIETFELTSKHTTSLEQMASDPEVADQLKVLVYNALGQVCHRAGKTNLAVMMFSQAKTLSGGQFVTEIFEDMVTEQETHFTSVVASEDAYSDLNMVFVGGMPGAGTSLLERVLSSHSEVTSIGESTALARTYGALRMHLARTNRGAGYWEELANLTEQEVDIFRQYYLERAFSGKKPQSKTVVDARPFGVFEFALAQKLFPNARFVCMTRDYNDAILANLATIFTSGNTYAIEPAGLSKMMNFVARSGVDFKSKVGEQMRVQSFEALVSKPEAEVPALLSQVGLSMDYACLVPQSFSRLENLTDALGKEEMSADLIGQSKSYEADLAPYLTAFAENTANSWSKLEASAD